MKFITVLFFTIIFASGTVAIADEASSRKSVEKLMELTKVSKMMDTMQGQMDTIFNGMAKQMGMTKEMGVSEKYRLKFEEYMQKVSLLIKEELNWETLKEPMIDIYVKHFSEKEVQGLINFYSSDLGRSMTEKMPLVMQDSMLISQNLMKKILPKIQALVMEMDKEIKSSTDNKK